MSIVKYEIVETRNWPKMEAFCSHSKVLIKKRAHNVVVWEYSMNTILVSANVTN